MGVRKEGDYWRVQIQRGGTRHSTTFSTQAEAKQYEAQVINEHKRGRVGKPATHTVREAMTRWAKEELPLLKSRVKTANHAAQLLTFLDAANISGVGEVWNNYKNASTRLTAATVNKRGAILRRIANLAYKEWGWLEKPVHIKLLKENNARHLYITKEQLEHLISFVDDAETKSLLRILFYTGMRIGEALKLKVAGEVLILEDTKNGRPRNIPIHSSIKSDCLRIPFKFKYHYYYDRFVAARAKAEMFGLHIHDIRHSTASALIHAGSDITTVRDILGHTSITTTNRYSHIMQSRLKEAIDKL